MINQYPLWKYVLIIVVVIVGFIYALPNLYGEDPAVQISATRTAKVDTSTMAKVKAALDQGNIKYDRMTLDPHGLIVRFANTEIQLQAKDLILETLDTKQYVVALNLAPATPGFLSSLGALPMYLGLDLRGGVHFLMQVDMDAAIKQSLERYMGDFRSLFRKNKVRYLGVEVAGEISEGAGFVRMKFKTAEIRDQAYQVARKEFAELSYSDEQDDKYYYLTVTLKPEEIQSTKKLALQQNIVTLRNRVNELGVAEPVIQQQGLERIVVQLPGVQDTARAKEILGKTATLEFRMVEEEHNARAAEKGRVPPGAKLYYERNGDPILLKNQVMLTGDYIVDASSGLDAQSGGAAVFISLDGKGGRIFNDATKINVGKLMAVVFIEYRSDTREVDGQMIKTRRKIEEVINVARIRERLGNRFQITGLDSTEEARDLGLLLRAGALAAPIDIVEERTVGPSLGQDNIDKGFRSVVIGFVLVLAFMVFVYRRFGLIANCALALNLVFIIAVLSMMQATLTLPGIAGIVLTVGMAVDANVLIFERIREELKNNIGVQAAINLGYEKALTTIADANITTFIAAIILFAMGTGPIKGFAITLSIGILTSMFTAIMVTRSIVNYYYGGKRIKQLSI